MVFGKVYSDHMFVADYTEGQWKDFRIEPYDLAQLYSGLSNSPLWPIGI
jgi:hypothetical protein